MVEPSCLLLFNYHKRVISLFFVYTCVSLDQYTSFGVKEDLFMKTGLQLKEQKYKLIIDEYIFIN
jgi:hypothetical protein